MPRLPVPGSDDNVWGNILNDFLSVEFNLDGTLRPTGSLGQKYSKPVGGIPETDLATGVQSKLNAVASGGVTSVNGHTGFVTLTTGDLGLGNVDNTSDLNKPISTAVQAALDTKATLESYDGSATQLKLIALADGSLRAVPFSAQPPAAPTNVVADAHLSFVGLSWDAVAGAVSYRIYRGGSLVSTGTSLYYADADVALNNSYSYNVQAVDQYGVWSAQSATVTVLIDPSINSAPTLASITFWPANPRPTDKVYVHVNSADVDAHVLATTLNTNVGALTATFDPTTWIWSES